MRARSQPLRPAHGRLQGLSALLTLALASAPGCCWVRPLKCLESAVYDELAAQVDEVCSEPGVDGLTELDEEAARDIWQRTMQYEASPEKQRGHLLYIRCARDDDYPTAEGMPEVWYESGWMPGDCASKYSERGRPPDGWELPPSGWLRDYREQWEEKNGPPPDDHDDNCALP